MNYPINQEKFSDQFYLPMKYELRYYNLSQTKYVELFKNGCRYIFVKENAYGFYSLMLWNASSIEEK